MKSTASRRPAAARGFSLAEILVVITVIAALLSLAGPLVRQASRGNGPATVAAGIAAELERAKTTAAAKNTYVWVHLGPHRTETTALHLVAWESADGTHDRTLANLASSGRAHSFENFSLNPAVPAYGGRPVVAAAHRPATAVWLRFSPSGEVHASAAGPGTSPDEPPEISDELARWIELGLQPTRAGKITGALERDTAVLHIAGLTGQIRRFTP